MEQFHHPRPVIIRRGSFVRPTPERERLVAGLRGRVVELGAGDGTKLASYPSNVEEIVLVEPDPSLREGARQLANTAPAPVRVVEGDLTRLPLPDGFADTVICSLVLCCSPRLETTLAEIRRVLRPHGEMRFYEHTRSDNPLLAFTEELITPIWSLACGGCHPARDPLPAIRKAFTIDRLERFSYHHVDHVVGVARMV